MCRSPTEGQALRSPALGMSLEQSPAWPALCCRGSGFEILQFFAGSVPAVHSDPSHSLGEGFPDLF